MKWRFVDRVTLFDPWHEIAGIKAVSLEEYYLLEPLGRRGVLPEVLVLECCVQLTAWLVAAGSGFHYTARLVAVDEFRLVREAAMGDVLGLHAIVRWHDQAAVELDCSAALGDTPVATAAITCGIVPVQARTAASRAALWGEICGEA